MADAFSEIHHTGNKHLERANEVNCSTQMVIHADNVAYLSTWQG
jgi:hypothetical protein